MAVSAARRLVRTCRYGTSGHPPTKPLTDGPLTAE